MIEDFSQKMDLQDYSESSWYQYFCSQEEFEHSASQECELLEENHHGNIWADPESRLAQRCADRSFAKDARLRLEVLKSGCDLSSCCVTDSMPNNSEDDLSDAEETKESALDLVEILDIEDDVQDDESWLYEPQRKQPSVEKDSALRWCRQVLDNRSPEMETACRLLMNKLDQRTRHPIFRYSSVSHDSMSGSAGSFVDKRSIISSFTDSTSLDSSEDHFSHDSSSASYKLQDITDVHIVARMQEASLRQDYVSMPSAFSRNQDNPTSCFKTKTESTDEFVHGNQIRARWPSALPSVGSSRCQSLATKLGCQSPKQSRLHQQVTQFKLLKRAQNQAASPSLTRSPLRTSLRSLQAVRNSRSLETDDYQTASQRSYPQPDVSSSTRTACGFRSLSPASVNFHNLKQTSRPASLRVAAVKGVQRSQSLSPCRIPHPAKGYLPVHGRVFASPERPSTAAWSTRAPPIQR